jgi:hypothetical protein
VVVLLPVVRLAAAVVTACLAAVMRSKATVSKKAKRWLRRLRVVPF